MLASSRKLATNLIRTFKGRIRNPHARLSNPVLGGVYSLSSALQRISSREGCEGRIAMMWNRQGI